MISSVSSRVVRCGGGSDAGPLPTWPKSSDTAITQAIGRWSLDRVGWRGFEAMPWVRDVKARYPDVQKIAESCSGFKGPYQAQLRRLYDGAEEADRPAIRSYFVGKLALEELSCRSIGPGAGCCDKRAAFMQIFQMLGE